jgi:hypothetical protein
MPGHVFAGANLAFANVDGQPCLEAFLDRRQSALVVFPFFGSNLDVSAFHLPNAEASCDGHAKINHRPRTLINNGGEAGIRTLGTF